MVFGETIQLNTKGYSDIKDITGDVEKIISKSKIKNGIVNVFAIGSTASVTTIEYEPALVEDVREHLNKLIPSDMKSRHSETWGDDNGFSHIRATLMGPGINVPLVSSKMLLGTWQQIVVIDHDNNPRQRKIFVQIVGE
ncbi:secondary thiamine-phosphate synthase enzyme YjbQ [Herbivorax sp. ANBcel31]|uniref:secondary thiamine-phosphate synthase enzyme YjbQ n=1 Tax=Herbivorax sp. ANBcel31 TaxID=3069754 RepID=UPI0027B66C26|nr:secondary thiamine-phosphate synthase enzyme YjbQ [Herbivorax sp. ANBcel31]MDQ2086971.1 secondary thiamine-phosphate synthase enzyme YjbQ [Herbivorax sp. ANBcel31]